MKICTLLYKQALCPQQPLTLVEAHALLALFQVVRRMPAERTVRCWSQFWDAFRHRWRTAWGAFLLTVLPLTAAGYGAWFYLHFARNNPVSYLPFAFCAVVFLTALLASSYLWGLLSEGRELTKETLLLSLRLGLGRPLRAALAAAGWYLPLAAAVHVQCVLEYLAEQP